MSDNDWPGYWAMKNSAGAATGTRDCVSASGEDTTQFLQGQLSQDVAALAIGASASSLLLHPQGKVAAYLRVNRLGENEFILDVDAGFGETVVTRLKRFLLRTKCDIELLDWQSVSLRGPDAPALAEAHRSAAIVAAPADGWGVPGVDLLGPEVMGAGVSELSGATSATAEELNMLRVEAGLPMMGAELTEDTIPEAAGIVDGAVSFTKGCYTGQELVARVDSRGGNVPKRLRRVTLADADSSSTGFVAGASLLVDDAVVGTVTSSAWSPTLQGPVAMAYVMRKVEVPAVVQLEQDSASVGVEVKELPKSP